MRRTGIFVGSAVLSSAVSLVPLVLGCGADFDPISLIERPRIVGAGIDVEGAPGRASPLPGDRVSLTPWLLQPETPSPVRAVYLVCVAADVRVGASSCGAMPLAFVPASAPSETLPPAVFTVPEAAALGRATQLLFLAATCDRGAEPTLDPMTFLPACDDAEARAEISTLNVPLAFDAATANHHPSLADESFTLTARAWAEPEPEVSLTGCASETDRDALPRLVVPLDAAPPDAEEPFDVEVTFTTEESDRESYGTTDPPSREDLQIAHFVTHGRTSRSASYVDRGTDISMPISFDWQPPAVADIPPTGVVVRFTWVVRDLRGGMGRADRALCLVPGA